MTPKERAEQVWVGYKKAVLDSKKSPYEVLGTLRLMIEQVIIAAIEEEREACARMLAAIVFDAREVLTLVDPQYAEGCRELQLRIERAEEYIKTHQPLAESESQRID